MNLRNAAAEAILAEAPPGTLQVLHDHHAGVVSSASELLAGDTTGGDWDAGLIGACQMLVQLDRRYVYATHLARSAYFADVIAATVESTITDEPPLPEVRRVARLINLFVTAFDGICDETPELLTQVLPVLRERFAAFPDLVGAESDSSATANPVVTLVLQTSASAIRLLAPALRDASPEFRQGFTSAVQEALAAQLAGTTVRFEEDDAETVEQRRLAVSGAALRVAVLVPVVFHPSTHHLIGSMLELGDALGEQFGWIDDLVDLERDRAAGQANMVLARLGTGDGSTLSEMINADAGRRWQAMLSALDRAGFASPALRQRLAAASLAWLGYQPQPQPQPAQV